jgi:hypothetical protein
MWCVTLGTKGQVTSKSLATDDVMPDVVHDGGYNLTSDQQVTDND